MWNSARKRLQTIAARPAVTFRQPSLSFPHLRRVNARLQAGRQIFDGRVLLNDVSALGLRVFSSMPLDPGTSVTITLHHPRPLSVRARVVEKQAPMREGHILSARCYTHRLTLEFEFASGDERLAVAEFVEELGAVHGIRSTAPIGSVEFRGRFV